MHCYWSSYMSDLAKLLGEEEYVPCSNLTVCAKPLQLVLRKKEKGIFKRTSYTNQFTASGIDEVLLSTDKGIGGPTSSLQYKEALFNNVQGIRHSRLTSASATDMPSYFSDTLVNVNTFRKYDGFADLKFEEIEELDEILRELECHWCFNKTHRLSKVTANAKQNYKLFFITGVVRTSVDISFKCRASGGFKESLKGLSEACRRYWKKKMDSLIIREGTALAYRVQKLEVDPTNGRISFPLSAISQSGDFATVIHSINSAKEIETCRLYYSKYFWQLPSEKQAKFRDAVVLILPTVSTSTFESLDEREEFVQPDEFNDFVKCCSSADGRIQHVPFLRHLMKMAEDALPTIDNPKEKEISDLLQELGVPGLLSLPKELDAVYGIRYLLTALWCVPPEARSMLRECASSSEEQEAFQVVKELELLLRCVAELEEYSVDAVTPKVQTFLSLALLDDHESFLYTWRATYVSALYVCGYPESPAFK